MQVSVDLDVCAATGGCAQVCPEVFEIGSDGLVRVLIEAPGEGLRDSVAEAADLCPTGAIRIEG
jgi:ferredoxin